MVRGAALALLLALAWARASVLVPTYVLPPDSFVRDQRSLGAPDSRAAESQRTIKRLVGGHIKIKNEKEYGTPKNSIIFDAKSETGKFVGSIAPDQSGGNVGWNQGIWDDGMLMSSAGEGKEIVKPKDDDEDKKTLSDQVAEGKYGLIQNEIFAKAPKRPGIVSYEPNSETRSKDNLQSLGGLKKEEIWLAEDHLLVLKGGSFPERTQENERRPWPPIDDYEAPNRQVKLPAKPKVPPPFPVRLSDDGPLVFLTPNGSVPAAFFPPYYAGEGEGPVPPPPFPFAPGAPYPQGGDPRNSTAGGAPQPVPPFPFLPGNASEGAFPFLPSMNGSFPEFPPGAAFLPPPSNQTDLYDEDDPSIYYPPPYSFSYRADYKNKVPAGPLVPGIILPPPPDFFAPLEEKTTTEAIKTTTKPTITTYARPKTTTRPTTTYNVNRNKYKTRPTTTESVKTTDAPTTVYTTTPAPVEIVTTLKPRKPQRIPSRHPIRVQNLPEEITPRPKTEKPVYKSRTKLTSKPLSVSVIYDYPDIYDTKVPTTTDKPYVVYKVPPKTQNHDVTSTPVPLRAYYSNTQNDIPTTKLQPVYNGVKPSEDGLASFYFYDEQPKTSPSPSTFFDGRNYYKTVPSSQPTYQQNQQVYQQQNQQVYNQQNQQVYQQQNVNTQTGFTPNVDVSYGAIDQTDALFLFPQKQGTRTLTQEYFSIQKPRPQPVYVQQPKQRPNSFYQQIADIQQTIDFYTTNRPKSHSQRPHSHKPKAITGRPVYQFAYQSKPRPEHNPFRAPKLDPEPFLPMVSYSKPFNVQNDFSAITPSASPYPQQYLIENVRVTTETPTSSRYYPKTKPRDDDYEDVSEKEIRNSNRNHIPIQNDKPASVVHHSRQQTTPNPISHGYYTKQDESYFDAITKNSFDIFGKKLEDGTQDVHGIAVTAPLETVRTPIDNNINLQYAYDIVETQTNPPNLDRDTLVNERHPRPPINPDSEPIPQSYSSGNANAQLIQAKPVSLADDTIVNDRLPRPTINPDSEFIPIPNPAYRLQQYRGPTQVSRPQYTSEQLDLTEPKPPTLLGDTDVNYKRPLPINPNAEWIGPVNSAEGHPGSFVSYRLPGEGAHVYFLTPQGSAQPPRERYRAPGYGR